MARAKRTDRADARRRYRATQSEGAAAETDAEPSTAAPGTSAASASATSAARKPAAATPKPAPKSSQPAPVPGERPSFTATFRAAARPVDLRSDIAYIPDLVLHTRAVLIPAACAVGSGVLFLAAQPLGSNGIANLLFQLFVLPPTIAGAFLAGILAPRATYIAGGLAALVGAIVFSVAVAITPINPATATGTAAASPSPAASAAASATAGASDSAASAAPSISPAPSPSAATGQTVDFDKPSAIAQSLLLSVPFGIAIGAFGGYYRRFLYLSNPSRQRREMEKQRQKGRQQPSGKKRY